MAAFDIRLNYDRQYFTFNHSILTDILKPKQGQNLNWSTDATNMLQVVQIGAFKVEPTISGLSTSDTLGW